MTELNTQYANIPAASALGANVGMNMQRNALLQEEQGMKKQEYANKRRDEAQQEAALMFGSLSKMPEEQQAAEYPALAQHLQSKYGDVPEFQQLPPTMTPEVKSKLSMWSGAMERAVALKRTPERPIALAPGGTLVSPSTGETWTAPEKSGFHVLPEGSIAVDSSGKQVATGQPKTAKEADTDKAITAAHNTIATAEYHKSKILSSGPTIEQQYVAKILGVDTSKPVSKEDQDRMIKAYDDQIAHANSIIEKHQGGAGSAYAELKGKKPGWKYNPDLDKSVYWDGTKVTKEQQGKRQ